MRRSRANWPPRASASRALDLYDVAWMAYSQHDIPRARAELRRARDVYPGLLSDPEARNVRWLSLRLKLPRAATEMLRALKRRT